MHFILNEKQPIECKNFLQWSKWYSTADKTVKKTKIDNVRISTVFLGINLQYEEGPPLLFETMISGGQHDKKKWKYTTWDEAEKGHELAYDVVRKRHRRESKE